jgi:hypothetical protein
VLFAASVVVDRPLVARFANDFCPTSSDVNSLPAISRLFRRLTYLWAALNLACATSSLVLLLTVPLGAFVGTTAASTWIITGSGVVLTVFASTHVARREGLATAVDPAGPFTPPSSRPIEPRRGRRAHQTTAHVRRPPPR